jgi:hypothetical protein
MGTSSYVFAPSRVMGVVRSLTEPSRPFKKVDQLLSRSAMIEMQRRAAAITPEDPEP